MISPNSTLDIQYHRYASMYPTTRSWSLDHNGRVIPEVERIHMSSQKPKITMESVIISDEKMEQINAAISQINNQGKIFSEWGFSEVFEKGTAISLLFYGVPGTGKTLMGQAIADKFGYQLKVVSTADINSMEPGGAERKIRQLFLEANSYNSSFTCPPSNKQIILFDECDSLLSDRAGMGAILSAQVNALLTEIEKYTGIVIFTTNRLGTLDPALERRITAKIEFEFPNAVQRSLIWRRMIPSRAPIHKDVDYEKLGKKFRIAGGNIKNAVLNAARDAAYKGAKQITLEHFETAARKEIESIEAFEDAKDEDNTPRFKGYHKKDISSDLDVKRVMDMNKTIKQSLDIKEKGMSYGE